MKIGHTPQDAAVASTQTVLMLSAIAAALLLGSENAVLLTFGLAGGVSLSGAV